MGPEATLWSWLRKAVKSLGTKADVHRIETSTESGYPDVEGCVEGSQFTCELKVVHYVRKRCGTFALPHYTQDQAYFAHRRLLAGGRHTMLVRLDRSHYLIPASSMLDVFDRKSSLDAAYLAGLSLLPHDAQALALLRKMSSPY